MIPSNIQKEHVIKAMEKCDESGVPTGRGSRKFTLEYNSKSYPPKYIICIANEYANGKELDSSEFSGGEETNTFLKELGFSRIKVSPSKKLAGAKLGHTRKNNLKAHHNERCKACKENIKALLGSIYGDVESNYKFKVGVKPEDYRDTSYYYKLKEIYETLQNNRGFKDFVKTKTLSNVDFFIPNPGFILEFDESQHFTLPRLISLNAYPSDLKLGFDRNKWTEICDTINAKDNEPVFRDEQRAWYDTLRDFIPNVKKLEPTVRLYSNDCIWCSLDPSNPADILKFKHMLKGESESYRIETRSSENPSFARIIISHEWRSRPEECKNLLEQLSKEWPEDKKVKFLITPGGFIHFEWPASVSKDDIGDNKNPNKDAVDALVKEAKKCVDSILETDLREQLANFTDYITLGIDSFKEKKSEVDFDTKEPHVELVFLINLKSNELHWTGKSHPVQSQRKGLVHIVDHGSHFVDIEGIGMVMILGCHDLNIFNKRSRTPKDGPIVDFKNKFIDLTNERKPVYVLHHPHTTIKARTWNSPWKKLKETNQAMQYAGAGIYYKRNEARDALDKVLMKTKCGNSIDFLYVKSQLYGMSFE